MRQLPELGVQTFPDGVRGMIPGPTDIESELSESVKSLDIRRQNSESRIAVAPGLVTHEDRSTVPVIDASQPMVPQV
jgi:hypothetical protein